jgi:hypothetical protein
MEIGSLNISVLGLVKIAAIIFMAVYSAFAAMILRQANVMSETLDVDFDRVIVAVARVHLFVSIVVFAAVVIIL